MRARLASAVSLLALYGHAVTLDVARLPAPSHADNEVSGDAAMPANRLDLLRVKKCGVDVF